MPDTMDDMKRMTKEEKPHAKGAADKLSQIQDKLETATKAMREPVERKGTMEQAKTAVSDFLAEHEVVGGDTLSGIALKHYGTAVRDKWMAIYEANKEIIGDNPSLIRVGQLLKIPKLD